MKAEELRIGNYAQDGERVGFIKSIQPKTIVLKLPVSTIRMSVDDLEPIPLTEDRFINLGFEKIDDYLLITEGRQSIMIPRYNEDDDFYVLYQEDIGCGFNPLRYVEYVHEIQNLWHSLTGKELTVKQ